MGNIYSLTSCPHDSPCQEGKKWILGGNNNVSCFLPETPALYGIITLEYLWSHRGYPGGYPRDLPHAETWTSAYVQSRCCMTFRCISTLIICDSAPWQPLHWPFILDYSQLLSPANFSSSTQSNWPPNSGGGLIKIIWVGIPTRAGMKTGS